MKQSHSSEADIRSARQKILYLRSLPFLQEPTSGPYPEHDESKKSTDFRDMMPCSLAFTASIFRTDKLSKQQSESYYACCCFLVLLFNPEDAAGCWSEMQW